MRPRLNTSHCASQPNQRTPTAEKRRVYYSPAPGGVNSQDQADISSCETFFDAAKKSPLFYLATEDVVQD